MQRLEASTQERFERLAADDEDAVSYVLPKSPTPSYYRQRSEYSNPNCI